MKQLKKNHLLIWGGIIFLFVIFQLQTVNVHATTSAVSWFSYDDDTRGEHGIVVYQNCTFRIFFEIDKEDSIDDRIVGCSIQFLKNNKVIIDYSADYYTEGQGISFCLNQPGEYVVRRSVNTKNGYTLTWSDGTITVHSVKDCGLGISVSPSTLNIESGKTGTISVKLTGLFQKYSGEKSPLLKKLIISQKNFPNISIDYVDSDHDGFKETMKMHILGSSPGRINGKIILKDGISGQVLDQKSVQIIVINRNINVSSNISKVYSPGKRFSLNARAYGTLRYTSSNPKVAMVSSNGMITMKGYGITTITVSLFDYYRGKKVASKKVKISLTPAKVTFTNVALTSPGKTSVSWLKVSNAQGYQIQCSLSKKFPSIVSQTQNGYIRNLKPNASKYKNTFSILKKNKTWYIRIRAYKKVNGHIVNGPWSNVKQIFVK